MNDSSSPSPNRIIQGPLKWLLWVATLVVVVTVPFIEDPRRQAIVIVHVSCIVFLSSMFGFWFGLAPVRPLKRIVNSLGLTTLLGVVFGIGIFWIDPEAILNTTFFCWVITLIVGATTFLLRLLSGQLQLVSESEHVQEALQFKVRDILVFTTAVAVLLAIGRQLKPTSPGEAIVGVASLGGIYASVSIVQIWAMLGKNVSLPRILVMTLALFAAAWFIHQLMTNGRPFTEIWISITFGSQLLVIGSLICIRRQGYRFVKTVV